MDFKYVELEEANARLQRDVRQLTDDNKLMWDLWKQVQASKPDITQIIAITVDRETKKYAAKEKHMWTLIEERNDALKRLEDQLHSKDHELHSLSTQVVELKASDASLRSRFAESSAMEERLKDEVNRLNKQLIDSDEVNNRLLVSMEKENTALKGEVDILKRELCDSEENVVKLKSSLEAANSSGSTLWSELASYRQMIAIMEAELSELKNTSCELRRALDDKQAELERVLASKENIADELNRHLARELEFQVETLTARNRELEAEMALRQKYIIASSSQDHNTAIRPPENLMMEISILKEQLARVTAAYEAKSLENELLSNKNNDRVNAIERLHSEQRAIQDGLEGLNQRLRKEKHDDFPADLIHELETNLETERLIAVLKQHCRELTNDRDVFAGRLEKALMQLANRESCIADLKLRIVNIKRDRETEFRKMNLECERRLGETSKQHASKLSSETSRQKSEVAALEKKLEMAHSEKRRLRAQLTACQGRLTRESTLTARLHDRVIELEQNALAHGEKLAKCHTREKETAARRRRTRSASWCAQDDSPPRQKKQSLTFDMAVQTDLSGPQIVQQLDRQPSPSVSLATSKASRKNSAARQQLSIEKMRVARLLRLVADLKTDRMKLRRFLEDERQARQKLETAFTGVRGQIVTVSSANKLLENKLTVAETDLARTRKALIDSEQRIAEMNLISPRVDKSVITDQFESQESPTRIPVETFEELKQRLAAMMATEREQTARLSNFQVECDRLSADLSLTKERLNDSRREHAKDRRLCEEQREKLQAFEQRICADAARIKELAERLNYAEQNDKNVVSRVTSLKRRVGECEADKVALKKQLTEKQVEYERLVEQMKKAKTRCQYLEVMATAEKTNLAKLDAECKEVVKTMQTQLNIQNAQVAEFRRFVEMYVEMLIDRIRQDRRAISSCEVSEMHKKQRQLSPSRRATSQQSDASLISRAASMAQAHLKLSAAEAAELLMVGSVDASPPSSRLDFDSPEAFHRKISNILRQICSENSADEDATQFANRLSHALFNGFIDHVRFLLSRSSCCLSVVLHRDEKLASSHGGDFRQRRLSNNRRFNANSSTGGGFSDSVFSGSPY